MISQPDTPEDLEPRNKIYRVADDEDGDKKKENDTNGISTNDVHEVPSPIEAGDAPVEIGDLGNIEPTDIRQAEITNMQNLPEGILNYLVGFLDYKTRKRCRFVCRTVKRSVDTVGLSVRIDSRKPGIADFCKRVKVTEAHIQNMEDENLELTFADWETVIFSGFVHPDWLNYTLIRTFPFLRIMIITEDCLVTQDFTQPLGLPYFQQLTQVHFYVHVYMSLSAFDVDTIPTSSDCPKLKCEAMNKLHKMDIRVRRNLNFLLSTIRSRVLKLLRIFGYINVPFPQERSHIWEQDVLYEFIETHRNSLEEIDVTCLSMGEPVPHPGIVRKYLIPAQLKQVCWGAMGNVSVDKLIPTFWKDLLLAQDSLEQLQLENFRCCREIPCERFKWLEKTFTNNCLTLKVIQLDLPDAMSLDMSIFRSLVFLQKLCITGFSSFPRMVILNLNQLPRNCLRSLKLEDVNIGDDFDGVKFMNGFQPEALIIHGLPVCGFFNPNNPKYMLKFAKLLLRCRGLNRLSISIGHDIIPFSSCATRPTRVLENAVGLALWLTNLAANRPANHQCTALDISDTHDVDDAIGADDDFEYLNPEDDLAYREEFGQVNLDYLDLVRIMNHTTNTAREQPFLLPRNADSYTVWEQDETLTFRAIPNFTSYTSRVQNMNRVRVKISFIMDKKKKRNRNKNKIMEFWPVTLKTLERKYAALRYSTFKV